MKNKYVIKVKIIPNMVAFFEYPSINNLGVYP